MAWSCASSAASDCGFSWTEAPVPTPFPPSLSRLRPALGNFSSRRAQSSLDGVFNLWAAETTVRRLRISLKEKKWGARSAPRTKLRWRGVKWLIKTCEKTETNPPKKWNYFYSVWTLFTVSLSFFMYSRCCVITWVYEKSTFNIHFFSVGSF